MSPDPFSGEADTFPAARAQLRAGELMRGRKGPEPPPAVSKGVSWPLATTLPATDAALNTLIAGIYSDLNASINRSNFNLNNL